MAKLPSFKRITKSDFPQETYTWIDRMAFIVNNAFEPLFNALNHGLTFADNFVAVVKDITLTVDSNGIPIGSAAASLDNIVKKVTGAEVIFAQNQTNSTVYPTSAPFITGTQSGNTYIINHISGLQANNVYLIRVRIT